VLPLAGASALLLALAASGLNGQSFAFVGYLPQEADGAQRAHARTGTLSRQAPPDADCSSRRPTATRRWPPRCCRPAAATRLSISCGLTLPGGWTRCLSVERVAPIAPPQVSGPHASGVRCWLA
jgi:16S rRNA (cytidine1402-2'-O)-methyltransferase